jgi:uncharacterized membrane protein
MSTGPVQLLIVLGLLHSDFHDDLLAELERLHDEGIARVIDALALDKDAGGEVEVRQLVEAGEEASIGLDCGTHVLAEIPNGSSAVLVLLEHHWAWRLHDVIAGLGGFGISDGFIVSPLDLGSFPGARSAPAVCAEERVGAVDPVA